jgi:hypothetical protein
MKNQRKIKVSAQRKFCAKHRYYKGQNPKIILSGEWLAKAGFNVGDCINISVGFQSLIINF